MEGLYERAASEAALGPLWHVAGAHTFFAGPLIHNASHQHGAPVYLAGLYGRFRLRIGNRSWSTCRTAMIPAGVPHELILGGEPVAVFYIEPCMAGHDALVPLVRDAHEEGGAVIGDTGEITMLRELYEDRDATSAAGEALADLLACSAAKARREIDGRLRQALALLHESSDDVIPAAMAARSVGLSASRFQHLFTAEIGVPYRRYRAWLRMRRSIREIVAGSNFTAAAHAAGFCDQAHFAHDFRRTFGAPASVSLLDLRP